MKTFVLFLLILSAGLAVAAQQAAPANSPKDEQPRAGKTLAASMSIPGGWTIWPLATIDAKVSTAKPVTTDGVKVQTKVHTFSIPQMVSADICGFAENDREGYPFYDPDRIYRVDSYTTYEVRDRIFAYEVTYNTYVAETGHEIGAGLWGLYIDEDGLGEFRINCKRDNVHRTPVPKWIKDLAAAKK